MPKTRKPKGLSELPLHAQHSHERCIREAEHLTEYWAARGHKVHATIIPVHQYVDGKPTKAVIGFAVTSDMVNGLPRSYHSGPVYTPPKVRRVNPENAGGLFHY